MQSIYCFGAIREGESDEVLLDTIKMSGNIFHKIVYIEDFRMFQ